MIIRVGEAEAVRHDGCAVFRAELHRTSSLSHFLNFWNQQLQRRSVEFLLVFVSVCPTLSPFLSRELSVMKSDCSTVFGV